MSSCSFRHLLLCVPLLAVSSFQLRGENLVAVLSTASPEYAAKRLKDGKLTPETYVVMKGHFIPGFTVDHSLTKTKFADVVRRLAPALRQQEYYPAKDIHSADIVLVIHWGATSPRVHENQLYDINRSNELTGKYNEARAREAGMGDDTVANFSQNQSWAINTELNDELLQVTAREAQNDYDLMSAATLLGLSGELRKENAQLFETTYGGFIRTMLEEDRYFINVTALDAHEMFEQKRLKRLWSAKLSIRSPGFNFGIAAERISVVGGQYFGTNQLGLKTAPAKIRQGKVEIGDTIVIE